MTLAEAAAQADAFAEEGNERELAKLRAEWDELLEASARGADFRDRAIAYRAIGQFRFRTKKELLRRGLEDESPAVRGSALLALERLSRDHPGDVNDVRPLLHGLVTHDGNEAVRRLAVVALKNGSPRPDTIQMTNSRASCVMPLRRWRRGYVVKARSRARRTCSGRDGRKTDRPCVDASAQARSLTGRPSSSAMPLPSPGPRRVRRADRSTTCSSVDRFRA